MDEEELAKSLIDAAREAIREEERVATPIEPLVDTDDLEVLIRSEARQVQSEFRSITDPAERRRFQERYAQLDRWMGALQGIEAMPDRAGAAELKQALRGTVTETVQKWRRERDARRRQQLESDAARKHKENAGAGPAIRRIRDEIELLLKNYTKANDYKIQSLVDKWRRTGDPGFDPSIMARLQSARKHRAH